MTLHETGIEALNVRTGLSRWTLPEVGVCRITASQKLVNVNGQLVTIDQASGQQLSEGVNGEAVCPTVLPEGISVTRTDGGRGDHASPVALAVLTTDVGDGVR